MSRKPVVWITRPQPGADRTAATLAERGYDPFVLPLTEIRACDPGLSPDETAAFDAVAVTSANALRHAPQALLDTLTGKPIYTVGDATAAEAEARGFSSVISAEGGVEDLVALIANLAEPGTSILYLCGQTRTGEMETKLAKKGFPCRVAEVYKAKIVSHPTDYLRDALNRRAPDAVLFHSGSAARTFMEAVWTLATQLPENALLIAMSARIAEALPADMQARIIVSAEPSEKALLAALREALPAEWN